jgi:hypothetical protein
MPLRAAVTVVSLAPSRLTVNVTPSLTLTVVFPSGDVSEYPLAVAVPTQTVSKATAHIIRVVIILLDALLVFI